MNKYIFSSLIGFYFSEQTLLAQATQAAGKQPSTFESLILPFGIMLLIMYFLMIRPQQKKMKEHQETLTTLKKGDEVITTGGIIAPIRSVSDEFVTLDLGGQASLKIAKQNISAYTHPKK